jgi:uncharacterized membrane protein SpoIIM required for sporulation
MWHQGTHHTPPPPPWGQGTANRAMQRWKYLGTEALRWARPSRKPRDLTEVEHFNAAYRRSATELARVKAFSPDKELATYIEQAVAVAHFAVHRRRPPGLKAVVIGAVFVFPDLVRRYWRYHAVATAVFMLAMAVAFVAVLANPDLYYLFVDRGLAGGRDPGSSTEYLASTLGPQSHDVGSASFFTSFLFTNNTRVAFLCFVLGIAVGVPTLYLLAFNGLMLGAFSALFVSRGLTVEYLAWILPHGVPEIGAILLCGGAGLAIGHRLLNPGGMPRSRALRITAGHASIIAMGCVPLLLLAGLIEGVFRQSEATTLMRYMLFLTMLVGLGAWIVLTPRRNPEPDPLQSVHDG